MRAGNQRQAVVVVESLRDILAERIPGATGGNTPAAAVIRVRPKEIAHGALMRHFLNPIESFDVIEGIDTRRKTAVQTEDLVVDESGEGEIIEEIGKVLPDISITVLAKALVVEAVDLGDLARLVVASEDGNSFGVSNLERDEEGDRLDRVVTSVDIVSHEEIIGIGVGTANLEQLHKIVKLAVDVPAHRDGAFDRLYVGFSLENLTCLLAQSVHIRLGQLLAGHQALDPTIQSRDGGFLNLDGWQVGGSAPDILHGRIHYDDCSVTLEDGVDGGGCARQQNGDDANCSAGMLGVLGMLGAVWFVRENWK